MATLKQIVLKAAELKKATEILENLQEDRATAIARVQAVDVQITAQQPVVIALRDELKVLINE